MDLDIEEEPQFSKMSSPEHHQFAGMDTETETETEMSQVSFCIGLENVRLTAWVQISFFFPTNVLIHIIGLANLEISELNLSL